MRILLTVLVLYALPAAAQNPVAPPPLSGEQEQRLAAIPADVQVYEQFRYWAGFQPPDVQAEALRHYDDYPPKQRLQSV